MQDLSGSTRDRRPPAQSAETLGWPPICTLAELARILTLIHGVQAPTESSLKKWSAAGAFRSCVASQEEVWAAESPSSTTHAVLQRPRRAGRPGLALRTATAIARVYELWPFLSQSDSNAVVELVVARTADHLRAALSRAAPAVAQTAPAPLQEADTRAASAPVLHEIERQLALLNQEMIALKKEVAQFSALRNNLVTRLDDAVARAKEALVAGVPGGSSLDPLVEARRDRDMGVMKSALSEILAALERIEGGSGRASARPAS
jgi:hypothetical protein